MITIFQPTIDWIKDDFHSHPVRFILEFIAWIVSIGIALTMAFTVPNPPLQLLYPFWISSSGIYAWAAWTRRSFGMLANYLLLTSIDTIGLIRMAL
jgi:hypothetical protein